MRIPLSSGLAFHTGMGYSSRVQGKTAAHRQAAHKRKASKIRKLVGGAVMRRHNEAWGSVYGRSPA